MCLVQPRLCSCSCPFLHINFWTTVTLRNAAPRAIPLMQNRGVASAEVFSCPKVVTQKRRLGFKKLKPVLHLQVFFWTIYTHTPLHHSAGMLLDVFSLCIFNEIICSRWWYSQSVILDVGLLYQFTVYLAVHILLYNRYSSWSPSQDSSRVELETTFRRLSMTLIMAGQPTPPPQRPPPEIRPY